MTAGDDAVTDDAADLIDAQAAELAGWEEAAGHAKALIEAQQARIAELEATVGRCEQVRRKWRRIHSFDHGDTEHGDGWVQGLEYCMQDIDWALRPPHDGEEVDGG